jgi:hypothetical protein
MENMDKKVKCFLKNACALSELCFGYLELPRRCLELEVEIFQAFYWFIR